MQPATDATAGTGLLDRSRRYLAYRLLGSNRLLRVIGRFGASDAAAQALAAAVEGTTMHPGEPNVLFVLRNPAYGDVKALRRFTRLNWYALPNGVLAQMQKGFVPQEMTRQTVHALCGGADAEAARDAMLTLARKFFDRLSRRVQIHAIVSENFDYWQDLGLIRACRERGIPFLVLCREHGYTEFNQAYIYHYYRFYRFKFEGTAIAVWGDATERTLVDSGVAPRDAISVTGAPRFDLLRDRENSVADPDCLTLLSFSHRTYGAPQTFLDTLQVFADRARAHAGSQVRFVVKCRDGDDAALVQQNVGADRLKHLEIEISSNVHDLLSRSRLAIGFNSTTVLEGLFSDSCLVVPSWGDALEVEDDLVVDPHDEPSRKAFLFPSSPDELGDLLDRAARGEALQTGSRAERRALFDRYIRFPEDTTCSALVEAFVRHHIEAVAEAHQPAPMNGAAAPAAQNP